MSEEEINWNMQWAQLEIHPRTWHEVALLVNDYMRLTRGSVVYEEATADRTTFVHPNIFESISDLLHLCMPRMREKLVPGKKFAVIKVRDEGGKTIVHTTFEPEALCTFNSRRIMSIGSKLKRAMEAK